MFKPVPGWEGFYEVNEIGQVRSIARVVTRSDGSVQTWRSRLMRPMLSSSGYLLVRLSRPGKRECARVHRIVAQAFIPNPDDLPEVNHLNGVRSDPRATNLEWVTPSGNRFHAVHTLGTVMPPRRFKLTPEQVGAIRSLHGLENLGYRRIAALFNVDSTSIRDIILNRTHRPLPSPPAQEDKP
jgi:hypothetical protein